MDATFTPTSQALPTGALGVRLRPRTAGQVIDQAFRLYGRHLLAILESADIESVPVTLLVTRVKAHGSTQ